MSQQDEINGQQTAEETEQVEQVEQVQELEEQKQPEQDKSLVSDYDTNPQMKVSKNVIKGPLSMKGNFTGLLSATCSPRETDALIPRVASVDNVGQLPIGSQQITNSQMRKAKKRLQLKNLILLKFRNKFACTADSSDELNKYIQDKVDELFLVPQFDERTLVRIDKEIQLKFEEILKREKQSEKAPQSEKPEQATLKKIEQVEDLKSCKQEEDIQTFKTFGNNTRYKQSILEKAPTQNTQSLLRSGYNKMPNGIDNRSKSHHTKTSMYSTVSKKSNNVTPIKFQINKSKEKRPDDIFSQAPSRQSVKQVTAVNNQLAGNFLLNQANAILNKPQLIDQLKQNRNSQKTENGSMQVRVGNVSQSNLGSMHSKTPLKNENDIFAARGQISASDLFSPQQPLALKQIRARQEDYWNKIAMYNFRVHQMELKEKEEIKSKNIRDMREMLGQQLQTKKDNRDSEMRKDRAIIDEAQRQNDIEKQKARDKAEQTRLKLQQMNTERDKHIIDKTQEWNNYQKELKDYQQMMVGIDNEQVNKEKKDMQLKRHERTQTAQFNLENHHQLIQKKKLEREAEKRKYSYTRGDKNRSKVLSQKPVNQSLKYTSHTEADDLSQPMVQGVTYNLQQASTMQNFKQNSFFPKQQPLQSNTPEYEDLLSCLFVNRRHQAYDRRERADRRVEFVQHKFKGIFTNSRLPSDSKIQAQYEKHNKTLSERLNKQKVDRHQKTMSTRDFQFKQMEQKVQLDQSQEQIKFAELLLENNLKNEHDSAEKDKENNRRKMVMTNQNFLRQQIEERNNKEVSDCNMHKTDLIFNQKLLKSVNDQTPVLAQRSRRKPF